MIVSVHADGKSGEGQGERIVLAVHDGGLSMAHRGRPAFLTQPGAQEEAMMAHRGERVRQRIGGIEREGTFQEHQRLRHALRHPGIDVGLDSQDEVVGAEAIRPHAFDALDLGPTQARLDRADDR